jgi:tetratricopeptide (TPR) repeat protein
MEACVAGSPCDMSSWHRLRLVRRCVVGASVLAQMAALGGCKGGWSTRGDGDSTSAARKDDDAGMIHVAAAEDAIRVGDTQAALREFEQAIEVNPDLTTAHMGMGDIYRMQGDYAKAEAGYREAARIEPRNFDAQFYHGLMLHMLDRVGDAIQAYLRALSVKPDDFQANLNVATAYYQLNENQRALEFGLRAVQLNPRDGAARYNLGAIYRAMEQHREAVVEFQQAMESQLPEESRPELLLNLADSLGKLDRFGEMRGALEELVKTNPSAEAWERLGFARFRLGKGDRAMYSFAEEAFDNSLAIDGDYFPALNGKGVCLLNRWIESGRNDEASRRTGIELLRRSVQVEPAQPRIVELLSRYGR